MILSSYFRMSSWGLVAAAAAVAVYFLIPQEAEVALWKGAMVVASAYAGYWLDRTMFPYARPHLLMDAQTQVAFVGAMIRRAMVTVGVMVAVAVAL